MPPDARLLKESLAHVDSRTDRMVLDFYARLFYERPDLRNLFPAAMDAQRDRLLGALLNIVQGAERPEFLEGYLAQLGRDHRKYGVRPDDYDAVGRALLGALAHHVGDAWTPAMEQEWLSTYRFAARTMIEAAECDAERSPPWWNGEVVAHERRGAGIAVLTVRPDAPLPYTAGQYVSVETARWPRVWRTYSVANAPRADGSIELHVRAVHAGWVSGALVYHTRVGDTLRLGPARGSMVLDPASSRPVVCVAGGTGFAPVKALTEELTRAGRERTVHVFFGARTREDLYDLRALDDLAVRNPRLIAIPAVSGGEGYLGEGGPVSDVVLRYGPWTEHDMFVCGSPDMIRATVEGLQEHGVPLSRIHYDDPG